MAKPASEAGVKVEVDTTPPEGPPEPEAVKVDPPGKYRLNPRLQGHEFAEVGSHRFTHDEGIDLTAEDLAETFEFGEDRSGNVLDVKVPYFGKLVQAVVRDTRDQ